MSPVRVKSVVNLFEESADLKSAIWVHLQPQNVKRTTPPAAALLSRRAPGAHLARLFLFRAEAWGHHHVSCRSQWGHMGNRNPSTTGNKKEETLVRFYRLCGLFWVISDQTRPSRVPGFINYARWQFSRGMLPLIICHVEYLCMSAVWMT